VLSEEVKTDEHVEEFGYELLTFVAEDGSIKLCGKFYLFSFCVSKNDVFFTDGVDIEF